MASTPPKTYRAMKREKMIAGFAKKQRGRKPGEVSDVRSSNPVMGKQASRGGYAIPYSQDTSRSVYKRGRRDN